MKHYDFLRGRPLIFLTSITVFSLLFFLTFLYNMKLININANNYFTPDAREFILEIAKEDEVAKLFDVIADCDVVSIKTDEDLMFYYFNEASKYHPDFSTIGSRSGHGVLLGKELYNDFLKSGDAKYSVEGRGGTAIKANVEGFIKNSKFDYKSQSHYLLMDFNSKLKYFNGVYLIEGEDSYNDFKELEREGIIRMVPLEFTNFDTSGDEFFQVKLLFFIGGMILLCVVFTLVSKLWLGVYLEELKVRKLVGADKYSAMFEVGFKYLAVILLGVAIGILIYLIYLQIVFGPDYQWLNVLRLVS